MKTKILVATSLLMLTVVSFAWAPSPKYQYVTATLQEDHTLKVSWREVNLPPGANVTYFVTSTAPATYACVNSSGNCVGATQYVSSGGAQASITIQASKKGVVDGTVILEPPDAPSTFTCGGGQTMVLAEVAYGGITVFDMTNGPHQTASPAYIKAIYACN
jgi:hypothetical protein